MSTSTFNPSSEETSRLVSLEQYKILDTDAEQAYDDLTELAAYICGVPSSLISLVSSDRQFFKSRHKFEASETPRAVSFCAHTIESGETLIVQDASQDIRFADNPLVTGETHIRFYAGAPIIDANGLVMGTVCVIDTEPRQLNQKQVRALEALARQATELMRQRLLISSQQDTAEVRSKAEAQLRLASEAGNLGIFTWYPATRHVTWGNDRMYEIMGRSRESEPITAEGFIASVVHPESQESIAQAVAAIQEPGDRMHWIGKYFHSDGSVRWLEFFGLADRTNSGLLYMIGTARDVTEQKNIEEALALEKERVHSALSIIQATTFEWEIATDRVTWSGDQPFGRDPATMRTAADVWAIIHAEDAPGVSNELAASLDRGTDFLCDYRAYWPDGTIRWVRAGAKIVRDRGGKAILLRGVNLEITDRKLAEVALLRHEKLAAVGRLASTMSHELNNPLEALTNLLYIAKASSDLTSADREVLEMADRELTRISHAAAQTLRFNRELPDSGSLVAKEAVDSLLELYQTRLTDSKIEVRFDLKAALSLQMNERDFRQVLDALVSNAFDAMRNGGQLHIRVQKARHWTTNREGVSVLVVDTGSGIPENLRHRAFEAFFSTKGIHGAGLGLWTSKRIVIEHNGHIKLRTRVEKPSGTVVRVWIPAKATAVPSEPVSR